VRNFHLSPNLGFDANTIGVLLDRGGIFVASLVVFAMGVFFGIFNMMRSYAAQLVAVGILVLLRPLMYTFGMSSPLSSTVVIFLTHHYSG
jgi:hypothetical protein